MPILFRHELLRSLDCVYDDLCQRSSKNAPQGIPVGGGDWMDDFFKAEALRGFLTAYRDPKATIEKAIEDGKIISTIAVKIWNKRREWQVHRCEETAHRFLENTVWAIKRKIKAKKTEKKRFKGKKNAPQVRGA